jgi:hypothetical protein
MLGALIAGERDPAVLADLAKGKLRAKIPALTEALTAHFDAGHSTAPGARLFNGLDRPGKRDVDGRPRTILSPEGRSPVGEAADYSSQS